MRGYAPASVPVASPTTTSPSRRRSIAAAAATAKYCRIIDGQALSRGPLLLLWMMKWRLRIEDAAWKRVLGHAHRE